MTDTTDTTERPAHCRSPLWDHVDRIRTMLGERYSYEQIARALTRRGVTLTASEIGKWCRRQGLRSVAPSRHRRVDKKSAATAANPLSPAAPAPASSPAAGKAKSISALLAEDEAAQAASLGKFFPSSKE